MKMPFNMCDVYLELHIYLHKKSARDTEAAKESTEVQSNEIKMIL
jgi:hypothetical protein